VFADKMNEGFFIHRHCKPYHLIYNLCKALIQANQFYGEFKLK
jgi:hypothetical protein